MFSHVIIFIRKLKQIIIGLQAWHVQMWTYCKTANTPWVKLFGACWYFSPGERRWTLNYYGVQCVNDGKCWRTKSRKSDMLVQTACTQACMPSMQCTLKSITKNHWRLHGKFHRISSTVALAFIAVPLTMR